MNRRHFIQSLTAAVAGFTILPAATTYSRVWRATTKIVPVEIDIEKLVMYRGKFFVIAPDNLPLRFNANDYIGEVKWID